MGAEEEKEVMSKPLWIIEDFSNGTWRVNQPYKIYKSEVSANRGLGKVRNDYGTKIPRRVTEFRAVEGEK